MLSPYRLLDLSDERGMNAGPELEHQLLSSSMSFFGATVRKASSRMAAISSQSTFDVSRNTPTQSRKWPAALVGGLKNRSGSAPTNSC